MKRESVYRDERTLAVENASFRWGYLFLSYGLIAVVAYRGLARGEESWDLLALVVMGGMLGSAYQASQRVLSRRWILNAVASLLLALLAAGAAVALMHFGR
jgi:hypothetical protein